jgi:hypothetical protein
VIEMADDAMRDVPTGYPVGTRLSDRVNLEKVSWGAIWSGAMVTIGMEILFLTFGAFIDGLFGGSTVWSMIWYLVTMAFSFYVGAWSAARLSDMSVRQICVLHGLSTWGLATLATGILAGAISGVAAIRAATPVSHSLLSGRAEEWGGVIWGGVMLSLITAYLGSGSAVPAQPAVQERGIPNAPMRRAS